MKKVLILLFTLVTMMTLMAFAPSASSTTPSSLRATLTGAAEAPGPGDSDGSGSAEIRFGPSKNPTQTQVCFSIRVSEITLPAIATHIHNAPVGVPGPIVVHLTPPDALGVSKGCVNVDNVLANQILAQPAQYYVNVHTTDFPAGAVRGQLSP